MMKPQTNSLTNVTFHAATSDRWTDLESLFGDKGAYGGCWCMFWRLARADFKRITPGERKEVLHGMLESGDVPGLLAYVDDQAIGWCSIGPRENYQALEKSRILKRVDDQPVWSIVCFFVAKPFRERGLMPQFLTAAIDYARAHGAKIVEGYPIDLQEHFTGCGGYMGVASAYRKTGFVQVGRASTTQLIMRYTILDDDKVVKTFAIEGQ